MRIKAWDIKRAIKKGDLEVFTQEDKILLNDPQSGECVQIGELSRQQANKESIRWVKVDTHENDN